MKLTTMLIVGASVGAALSAYFGWSTYLTIGFAALAAVNAIIDDRSNN